MKKVIGTICAITLTSTLCVGGVFAETIPMASEKYNRLLHRFALHYYGMNAPVPIFAAQIHQESTWRATAKSKYASGLSQFTPDTAKDVSRKYPELVANEPLDPKWAIQALLVYDLDLKTQVDAINECEDWAFTLAMYNGGAGWIWKEKNLAQAKGLDRNKYWDSVETMNARADWAKEENRGYPKRILLELQKLYIDSGMWGSSDACLVIQKEPKEEIGAEEIVKVKSEVVTKKPLPKLSLWQRFLNLF